MIKLPKIFKPNIQSQLIRVGKINDGGYVISKANLDKVKNIVCFGLDFDWSFEENLKKNY